MQSSVINMLVHLKVTIINGHRNTERNCRVQAMGKSGQFRDAKLKTKQMGIPGDQWFFPGTSR